MACIRIERANNGFTVSMTDPKIDAANQAAEIKRTGKWQNPNLEYVFESWEAVLLFVTKNGEKALPKPDFASSFTMLTEAEEEAGEDSDDE